MQDTAPATPKPRAQFRQWEARVIYRECGVVTDIQTYTVTMTRTAQGYSAAVDGRPVSVHAAARILSAAQNDNGLTIMAEVLESPAAPAQVARYIVKRPKLGGATPHRRTIGNAAAHQLHKELGRLKYRNHYATAAEVLGRAVSSLASLSSDEARLVRHYAYGQWGLVG